VRVVLAQVDFMSTGQTTCPSIEDIEHAALGSGAGEALRMHFEACDTCREALERVRADNAFLSAFAVGDALPAPRTETARPEIDIPGYEIVNEIHRGGQGVVYRAVQRGTHRTVAVKVMKRGPFATLADRSRFDREVEILGRLNHQNIVAVHHAGTIGGSQYFIMNYVDGRTLDEAIRPGQSARCAQSEPRGSVPSEPRTEARGRPRDAANQRATPPASTGDSVPPPDTSHSGSGLSINELERMLNIFAKVCNAVHAAHLRGVMHRDLKPSNILVDAQDEPFVLDFGLAKTADYREDSAMTRTGQFVGSLPWASPEQIEGAATRVDLRTDVYSLGAILFQLLTGKLPFDVDSSLRTAVDHIVHREPPRPSAVISRSGGSRIDDELDTIVLKCLSKDRDRRYQSAGELERDIRRYLADEPIEAKRDSAIYILRKTLKRYRFRVTIAAAFAVLLGLFAVVMAVLYKRSTRLEQQAVAATHSLSNLLSQSNIERGRMAGMLGNLDQAERLIWGELISSPDAYNSGARQTNAPPGPVDAYWALWELYRRFPCVLTLREREPIGRSVIASDDGLGIWTADTTGRVAKISHEGHLLDEYRFNYLDSPGLPIVNPSGQLIFKCNLRGCAVWRRGDHNPLMQRPVDGTNSIFTCVASRSGRHFAVLAGGVATLWRVDPLRQIAEFTGDGHPLTAVALSNDETRVALRDGPGGLQIRRIDTGERLATIENTPPARESLHSRGEMIFSDDDTLLADSWGDTSGRIWNFSASTPTLIQLSDRPGDARHVSFSPDGSRLCIADLGGVVWTFDTTTGQRVNRFVAHAAPIRSISHARDGRMLWTSGAGGDIRAWDLQPDAGVRTIRIEEQALQCVDFDPKGRALIVGGMRGQAFQIDAAGTPHEVDLGVIGTVSGVSYSPDGRWVAAATFANQVCVWDPAESSPDIRVLPHPSLVSNARFSPDGRLLATACDDFVVRLWNVFDWTCMRELRGPKDRLPSIAFDPTGEFIAAAVRDGDIFIWSAIDGRESVLHAEPHVPIRGIRFLDGDRMVSAGAGRTVDLWNLRRKERTVRWTGHSQEIFCIELNADKTLIASGDSGGEIRLWHTGLGRQVATLAGHTGAVMSLQFSPDGRALASASIDGTVRVWNFDHYRRHIAGQVAAQLHIHTPPLNSADAKTWLDWADREREAPSANDAEPLGAANDKPGRSAGQ